MYRNSDLHTFAMYMLSLCVCVEVGGEGWTYGKYTRLLTVSKNLCSYV